MQKNIEKYLLWPIYIFAAAAAALALGFILEYFFHLFWLPVILFVIGSGVFAAAWISKLKKSVAEEMIRQSGVLAKDLKEQMDGLNIPYVLTDAKGEILWKNRAYLQMLMDNQKIDLIEARRIQQVFHDIVPEKVKSFSQEYFSLGRREFRIGMSAVNQEGTILSFLFSDETDHLSALAQLEENGNVIGFVYIDNYEEVIKSTESVRQALLVAVIEQRVNKYFRRCDALVCRSERDRFVISLTQKGLQTLKANRFSLLEEVKGLNIGNDIPVTLSMAFGCGGETYAQNYDLARNAMDLALGRGGDQAIIKAPSYVQYFGGKGIQSEKQTRVKARVKAQALRELMIPKDRILIMGHKMSDNDAFGAAVGMYRAAATLQKKAYIVLDDISASVRPLYDSFQAAAEYPGDMFITCQQAKAMADEDSMVIVVDVNRPSYTECRDILNRTRTVVVLDHHRRTDEVIEATLSYIEPFASSTCEMVSEILQYFSDNMKLRPLEAESLYSGIIVDTNGFSDRTGVRTFEAAAFLRRSGANLIHVKKLFREKMTDYKAKAETIRNAELYMQFALGVCPAEGLESPTIVCAQAANELLNVDGVKASVVFTQIADTIYVSARSIDEVNVQLVMERLGGGGHLSVAGTQMQNCTIEEAKNRVKEVIKQMLEEGAI